ncbi:LysE family translocator [Thaumasiovibrio subtropicus]|uniref:LysE family translocator n=1 Tax=Thaumasiovibrio subtropicus TaxID=1891207 RepID=UPI000B35BE95|nr:LysE family translocator [Thaumasiovibrio subtropicus]
MNFDTLAIYAVVSFFYIISPGPAVFLAIFNGAIRGMPFVVLGALGNVIGLFILSSLSISGLSAVLMASSTLFFIVKMVGAGYLIYLGIKQLMTAKHAKISLDSSLGDNQISYRQALKESTLVAVTNPKPILFFAALFPQFMDTSYPVMPQFFIMTFLFMSFSFLSLFCYGYLARAAKGLLSRGNGAKWFQRISGGIFVAMGASLMQLRSTS